MEQFKQSPRRTRSGYGPVAAAVVTVGVYFASQVLVGVLVSLIPLANDWSTQQLEAWLSGSVFAQFFAILLVEVTTLYLIWLFLRTRKVALQKIGLVKPAARDIGYALAGYAVYFAAFIAISTLAKTFLPGLDLEQEQEIGFSKETTGMALGFIFASLVILPPITEEIVARGFLYTGLRSRLSKGAAAVITSILFAAAHLQWGSGTSLLWVAALDTFVLSLILVYLREKTASLWSPILVHMIKNGMAFLLLFVFKF
ncbi:MAG TPA: type II CAAX endopeptidase family protein [Candidatus Limnocylindria bacterium]|nr:type II CAAX endopeptidase family protein [Candidatus Limnocylindria bacterium]